MSYILDALRKADAERERGSVPGLHTQAMPAASAPRPAARAAVPLSWVAGAAVVLMAGGLAWAWLGRGPDVSPEATRSAEAAPAPAVATPVAAAAAVPTPAVVIPAPAPPAAPAPAAALTPSTPLTPLYPAPVAAAPEAPAHPAPRTAPASRHAAAKPPAAHPATLPVALPASAAAPAVSAPEAKVYAVNDLPADVRRDWPQLSIGGSIYSDTPASRFLIINGQIFHEGDTVANGLSLEQIKLKAAVLRYKGYRVGITF